MAILLAPKPEDVSDQLTAGFAACTALNGWANALLQTTLSPLDPVPDWYADLQAKLAAASSAAEQWIDTDGPTVTALFPSALIEFASHFTNAVTDLTPIMTAVGAAGHEASAQQIASIAGLIGHLERTVNRNVTAAGDAYQKITTFYAGVKAQRDAIAADIARAESELAVDENVIGDYEDRINSLEYQLGVDADSARNVSRSAATTSLSLFGTLFTFSIMTLATGGAALPLLTVAAAGLTLTADGAQGAADSRSVQNDLQALTALELELTDEERQVAGLKAVLTTLENLLNRNDEAQDAANTAPLWEDMQVRLESVLEVLQQPRVDVTLITALTHLADAQTAWQSISAAATNIESSGVTQNQTISLTSSSNLRRKA